MIEEMKTMKKGTKVTKLPDTVENKNNEEDIAEKFRKVYQELYNIEDDFTALGFTVYADDVVLLAPSINALSEMLKVTELFAREYKVVFSTHDDPAKSKSKCIYMTGKEVMLRYPAPLLLNGRQLHCREGVNRTTINRTTLTRTT